MTVSLYENQVLRDASGRMLRLLWLPPGDAVAAIDIDPKGGMPFWWSRAEIQAQITDEVLEPLANDPAGATIRADTDLGKAERAIRNERMDYIRPLVEDPERAVLRDDARGGAVAAHVREHGRTRRLAYDYLKLWWRGGQLQNALVPGWVAGQARRQPPELPPRKRGRRRYGEGDQYVEGIAVTPEIAQLMQVGLKFLNKGMSARQAHEEMLRVNFATQVIVDGQRRNVVKPEAEIPSLDQFKYHVVQKAKRGDILLARKGRTAFARQNRERLGTALDDTTGPGSHYQIDATIADIYLRSHENPDRLIGKPVLYIVIDVYSRMIVGFCVALSGPSWEVTKLALENAMADKVEYCRSLGIDITEAEWPARHQPRRLTCDRGNDVSGQNAEAAAEALGYRHVKLPPYRPDWKGLVESRFELIHNEEIRWEPGSCHSVVRGGPKHQLDGQHTMHTFTLLMLEFIRHYNARFEIEKPPAGYVSPDGRAPTPVELWSYGCSACAAPQVADPERVRAALLHRDRARESASGLRFRGLHYQPIDTERHAMFRRVPGRHWASYEVRYDPRDMSSILVVTDRGARLERFVLTPADRRLFAGWTEDEVKDYRAAKHVGRRLASDERRAEDSLHEARMADIRRLAAAHGRGVKLTRKSAEGIRQARAAENRQDRRDGAWTRNGPEPERDLPPAAAGLPPVHEAPAPEQPAVAPEPPQAPAPQRAPSKLDLIRAAREAARRRPGETV